MKYIPAKFVWCTFL